MTWREALWRVHAWWSLIVVLGFVASAFGLVPLHAVAAAGVAGLMFSIPLEWRRPARLALIFALLALFAARSLFLQP